MPKILVAEDDPFSREFIARLLERRGHQVVAARTGSEAWERILGERPDLILAEVMMPHVNGFELLERVRRNGPVSAAPVILITGLFNEGEAEVLASVSGARLIRKPISQEELLEGIDAALADCSTKLREDPPASARNQEHVDRITQVALKAEMRSLAMRESGERMRAIFDYSLNGIFLINDDGDLVDVNPAAQMLTGYSQAELLQMKAWDVVTREQLDFAQAQWRELIARRVVQGEISLQRKDGSRREIEYRAVAGILPRLHLSLLLDITQRKEAEREILRARDLQLALFDGFPTLIWRAGCDGECNYFNRTWLEFTGRQLQEELGDGWVDGVHLEDRERVTNDYLEAFRARRRFVLEYRLRRNDGEYRTMLDYGMPFHHLDGQFGGFIGACYDNTEQVETRRALQQANQQLHALSQQVLRTQEEERRHLARELHDQIGQGLTAAKFSIQAALQNEEPEAHRRRLDGCITLLDELTERVRELSLALRPPPLEDLGLVPALRSYLDRQAIAGGFHLEFFADSSLGRFSADVEIACFRVVQEAVTNVLRHADADRVMVELRRSSQALHVSICDNGVGFALAAVRSCDEGGKSLGLLGMRERVKLLGGEIDCRSEPGRGVEIHAFFPLAPQDANGQ